MNLGWALYLNRINPRTVLIALALLIASTATPNLPATISRNFSHPMKLANRTSWNSRWYEGNTNCSGGFMLNIMRSCKRLRSFWNIFHRLWQTETGSVMWPSLISKEVQIQCALEEPSLQHKCLITQSWASGFAPIQKKYTSQLSHISTIHDKLPTLWYRWVWDCQCIMHSVCMVTYMISAGVCSGSDHVGITRKWSSWSAWQASFTCLTAPKNRSKTGWVLTCRWIQSSSASMTCSWQKHDFYTDVTYRVHPLPPLVCCCIMYNEDKDTG